MCVALLAAYLLSLAGGALVTESRPFVAHHVVKLIAHSADNSFLSDHATAAFAVAIAIGVFLYRIWGAVLFLLGMLLGYGRVFVSVQ